MSVNVVAIINAKEGRLQDVIEAFGRVVPDVHQELGCELYAAHTDGERLVVVERWATSEDLQAHSVGAAIAPYREAVADLIESSDVIVLENVPFGDPLKGTIQ